MLRRTEPAFVKMRNRKKWPYMIHHNRLPWNTVEPGTDLSHKILGSSLTKVLSSAANLRINGLVLPNEQLPQIPEDQWLFALPSSTFIVPLTSKQNQQANLVNVASSSSGSSSSSTVEFMSEEAGEETDSSSSSSPLAPFGWFGKRVVDELCLTHYGPIHATIAPVQEVAEYRSPDLRLICNAIKFKGFLPEFMISPNSSLSSTSTSRGQSSMNPFVVYHFYRPNRAPTEMEAAFKQFEQTPIERPDLSALEEIVAKGSSFKPVLSSSSKSSSGGKKKASPMPIGEVPTSPQYGLIEREAIRPGDAFGCRSRAWGHHW